MRRTLLIIDPQYDFIYGSLAVDSGEDAIKNIVRLLKTEGTKFDFVVLTMDQHPLNHCSFKSFGGIWPPHCRKYTSGATIQKDLTEELEQRIKTGASILFVEKGCDPFKEEYSAFEHHIPQELYSADEIVVCGIAGDFCVLNSVKDLLAHKLKGTIKLFMPGIASIDDGTTLKNFIQKNNLKLFFDH